MPVTIDNSFTTSQVAKSRKRHFPYYIQYDAAWKLYSHDVLDRQGGVVELAEFRNFYIACRIRDALNYVQRENIAL